MGGNILQEAIDKYNINGNTVIYNADETALLYNRLPNYTFMQVDENTSKLHGDKVFSSKEKVILMVCIGEDGTKFPLTIIGKIQNPC